MLLAVDVGNSQTAVGVFDGPRLVERWRVATSSNRTQDEYRLLFEGLLGMTDLVIDSAVVASVVPAVTRPLRTSLEALAGGSVLAVGAGIKTGMPMQLDNPREVGADRVANAVAAKERYGTPVIVVDFGTATTVDAVDASGAFRGGAISAGIAIALDALVESTSALRRVDLVVPPSVIGRNTAEAIQSGMLYGFAGLVSGLVDRFRIELGGGEIPVVATGGFAPTLAPLLTFPCQIDEHLTLVGLQSLFARNVGQ
ncbi:MAG: type III pantothenate kinase [Acidimicrobiia bacterium]|nr:type III pantothenate kinase [Acidimicrobiia bacterium]